jgi:uroporphyrinogen decarboxylase
MTSLERVITALERKKADRVPLCEMFINSSVMDKIYKGCSYADFVEKYGIDVITVPSRQEMKKIGKDTFIDSWQIVYKYSGNWDLTEVGFPISSKDDLPEYEPPDPLDDFRLDELRSVVQSFKGEKAIIFALRDSFSRPRRLMGMENLLINYILDPDFVLDVVEMAVKYNLKLLVKAIEEGADIIITSDDYASNSGTMMSPAHFEKFVLPGLDKMVKKTHELGAKYIKHSDGNILPILDMIIDTGIDGLHPIDPGADMNIFEVKKKYGDRICVIGNVDCKYTLCEGTQTEVEDYVKNLIAKLAPGGGYMLSSSNSIHSGVKPENFLAMIEATEKFGKYPVGCCD